MNKRKTGSKWEEEAAKFLASCGLNIKEQNFRSRFGEIDIVATDGNCFVFAEVKYRNDNAHGYGYEAVDSRKIKKICKCAKHFLYANHYPTDTPVRFDVISIEGSRIEHFKNAFEFRI